MRKEEIVDLLNEIADVLEIKGVGFKPRAYRRAAREIEAVTEEIEKIHEEERLQEIEAVGENIAQKISEFMDTGKLQYLEKLREEIPVDIKILKVQGLGPKTAKKLFEELNVTDLNSLKESAEGGKIRKLEGLGKKTEEKILSGIEIVQKTSSKNLLGEILPSVKEIIAELENSGLFSNLKIAGSLRRKKHLIGDVDILASSSKPKEAMEVFTKISDKPTILGKGTTKSSIRTRAGLQVDLRIIDEESFGAALQYFTGSKEHNVRLREIAIDQGYKLNEYGLFEAEDEGRPVARRREEDIYDKLGLSWMPPELREDRGEISAAKNGTLPDLIELQDIKGDLHCHSETSSDARASLEELAEASKKRGYEYLALTDHVTMSGIIMGVDEDNFNNYLREIREVNDKLDGFRFLAGLEVNIKKDGSLDLPNKLLKELDIVLAGIHSNFQMSEEENTKRLIRAIENDIVDIIAHPRGRKIGERGSLDLDFPRILEKAKKTGTALEINASPVRSDLDDIPIKQSIERGVKLSIGTDSHRVESLEDIDLGLFLARRGWCRKEDVLNTLSYNELNRWLDKDRTI